MWAMFFNLPQNVVPSLNCASAWPGLQIAKLCWGQAQSKATFVFFSAASLTLPLFFCSTHLLLTLPYASTSCLNPLPAHIYLLFYLSQLQHLPLALVHRLLLPVSCATSPNLSFTSCYRPSYTFLCLLCHGLLPSVQASLQPGQWPQIPREAAPLCKDIFEISLRAKRPSGCISQHSQQQVRLPWV